MRGLFARHKLRYRHDQRHALSIALRFLGFGNRSILTVPTDTNGEMDIAAFQSVLATKASPTIVILNAGDLNIGAFDSFERIVPLAKAAGAWVHIDGAFGLIARASRSKRPLLAGIELADSWATDGTMVNVPRPAARVRSRQRRIARA